MKKHLYSSVAALCLIMLCDTTMTAYGVAQRAGMEINPIILAIWNHLPVQGAYQFSLLTIVLYGIAIALIGTVLVYATVYAPQKEKKMGTALCYWAVGSHAVLFGSVLVLNVMYLI